MICPQNADPASRRGDHGLDVSGSGTSKGLTEASLFAESGIISERQFRGRRRGIKSALRAAVSRYSFVFGFARSSAAILID
jgi:hypothetical protein